MNDVWVYYTELCAETQVDIPQSFLSCRTSFKDKLELLVNSVYNFHVLKKCGDCEKGTVLVPKEFSHVPSAPHVTQQGDEEDFEIPTYKPEDNIFLSLVHVALKLRSDILSHPQYKGFKVPSEAAVDCTPDTVYMFLKMY